MKKSMKLICSIQNWIIENSSRDAISCEFYNRRNSQQWKWIRLKIEWPWWWKHDKFNRKRIRLSTSLELFATVNPLSSLNFSLCNFLLQIFFCFEIKMYEWNSSFHYCLMLTPPCFQICISKITYFQFGCLFRIISC